MFTLNFNILSCLSKFIYTIISYLPDKVLRSSTLVRVYFAGILKVCLLGPSALNLTALRVLEVVSANLAKASLLSLLVK